MERGPVIVVHGGAWAIPDGSTERSLIGVRNAAAAGWKRLQDGQSSAIDAVEAAVEELENDPIFDAGTGSVLTADGTVEMDAIIMNGADLSYGSVASVENIKNPVKLARLVMEKTEHTMLVGAGANRFAEEQGICTVPAETLVTAEAKADFERFKTYGISVMSNFSTRSDHPGHDTVGCVAFDGTNFAAATSTGGIMGKRPGRVGDSPLVGCGAYADNCSGAVSTTGHGESISKVCLARRIAEGCERGLSATQACEEALDYMKRRVGNAAGAICIDKTGCTGLSFTSERMCWAIIDRNGGICGINNGEILKF